MINGSLDFAAGRTVIGISMVRLDFDLKKNHIFLSKEFYFLQV